MNIINKILLLFILLSLLVVSHSQTINYRFAHLTMQNGLSHNQVQCIFQDSRGFIWFGTISGLNRYDGNNFVVYKKEPFDTLSLIDNSINNIYEDDKGHLWINTVGGFCIFNPISEHFIRTYTIQFNDISFGLDDLLSLYKDNSGNLWFNTRMNGLIKYNIPTQTYTQFLHIATDTNTISKNQISNIKQDNNGYYWIIHRNGILEKMDPINNKIVYRTYFLYDNLRETEYGYNIYIDDDNDIWIYTTATSMKLVWYNAENNKINFIGKETGKFNLNSDLIRSVIQDDKGKIWVGTDHGGINIIDKKKEKITYITYDHDNERTISQNSITSLYKDNNGIIWIGTFKQGINYFHEKIFAFNLYTNIPSDDKSLTYNDVNCFVEDEKKNIYIGTNGGGLIYFNRLTNTFSGIKHNPDNENSLSNDVVVCLNKDSKGILWAGTYYGGLNKIENGNFVHFVNDPDNPRSINDNRIWEIYEDSRNNLWIGTLGGGLELYDRTHNIFHHYSGDDNTSVQSNFILSIQEDHINNLWVGTDLGIFIMEWRTGKVRHLFHSESDHSSLSNNVVISIIEDKNNLMWIGTRDGLNLYHNKTNSFKKFRTENGLPDNAILSIIESDTGNLWMSTSNGISKLTYTIDTSGNLLEYFFVNFDESDGLQGRSFNEGAAYKTSKGEIIFGGSNGFNIFKPSEVEYNNISPSIYIVNFEIFGKPLKVGEKVGKKINLQKSIIYTKEITLSHKENVFSIEFAALVFMGAEKIKYRYKLENFNENWLFTDYTDRKVTYTNLDPGKYLFRVQLFQNENESSIKEATLNIIVKPPFWRSIYAYIIYTFVLISILLLLRQFLLIRSRLKFQNEQAYLEAQRQQELNTIKTRFFTNISHEFRAPLTLIITPIERILKQNQSPELNNTLKIIFQNAKRLLNLVNQLLDFRKMEEQRLTVNLNYGNVVKFIEEVHKSFNDLAETKNIKYQFKSSVDQLFMRFDEDKLEKILFNLLSNAFKFTHDGDHISVSSEILEAENTENILKNGQDALLIKVNDTGIGIPKEKHDKIFERFFQSEQPSTLLNKGSGIGLSLTNEFVKLHGGLITVDSEIDKGTCFNVYLPINRESIENLSKQDKEVLTGSEFKTDITIEQSNITILLVDDNEDFRFYLRDNLKTHYKIIEAMNGKEGIDIAINEIPDLIVSDLRMPEIDGLQFCKEIKHNQKTSHIPFILLTAAKTDEEKLEGYKVGADEYITKPFSFEILESRIINLIKQREQSRKVYQKNLLSTPENIGITTLDEKLMKKTLSIIEKNISDSDFSVEKLSNELGFSRVHLYKKMLSITGKTPVEFIRLVRLRRASQLLRESQLTVSEIAYQVGFSDPRYFSKQFKSEFKVLPSKYKADNYIENKQNY